ncbi:MAG: UDP-N-acetylmuramate--L-alanine ligase [Lachnospiraceae bacterium]|jgi:UDP-N-acetylmuramate--alanine ligase|nr:UDP-N-acetylmuramate--L-alanine ligase [Lachnospiraceae bacterium]
MYEIDFKHPGKAYFIGIGGVSMSGFALLLKSEGFFVTGSDMSHSHYTEELEKSGISINYSQVAENINKEDNIDFVVYTAAIHPTNPEYKKAEELGIPMMERAVMVGQVMKNYKNAISVAGTHGKTTTTSMLSSIFLETSLDPTISVGGLLDRIGGNIRIGHSENFILESCEYTNSFLKFFPTEEIILNIDNDHLDFFKNLDNIRKSFHTFATLIPEKGHLVINGEIPDVKELMSDIKAHIITFGIHEENAAKGFGDSAADESCNYVFDYMAKDISHDDRGRCSFDLIDHGRDEGTFHLNVYGEHNVYNALASIAMARIFGISFDQIRKGLLSFSGTHRRFEIKGSFNGVTVVDDYAHHPTEIRATLDAAKNYPHKNLWVVFQPHTYSRTKNNLQDFVDVLSTVPYLVLADIFAAREKDPGDISSEILADMINKNGGNAHYIGDFKEIEKFLQKNCINGDLLMTIGAGNVVEIGEDLVKK